MAFDCSGVLVEVVSGYRTQELMDSRKPPQLPVGESYQLMIFLLEFFAVINQWTDAATCPASRCKNQKTPERRAQVVNRASLATTVPPDTLGLHGSLPPAILDFRAQKGPLAFRTEATDCHQLQLLRRHRVGASLFAHACRLVSMELPAQRSS